LLFLTENRKPKTENGIRLLKGFGVIIQNTMGRMGEVNRFPWGDVNLEHRFVVLYPRKKKG